MPFGYLVSVGLVAVGTGFALVAPRRPRLLSPVAFRLGLVVNELPFLVFFLLLGSTVLAFAQGDISGPGWVAVGLAGLVTVGLGEVVRRGLMAVDAVGRAPGELPWGRILFAPFAVRRRGVERVANIRYGPAGRRNLLDVYRPGTPTGPTLVYWHGGGYFSGRKNREARALLYRLASLGWVCVSANYRLRPQATFPDHLVDAKRAIAWVRRHGREYGADPSRVVVAGSSAGGHLASLCALTQNDPTFQPGFEHADTSVAAAVSLYGYYGEYYGGAVGSSPHDHLRPDAPPFFLVHGDRDTLVPVEQARRFAERLGAVSANPVSYVELPGGHHSFDLFRSIRFDTVVVALVEGLSGVVHAGLVGEDHGLDAVAEVELHQDAFHVGSDG